MPRFRRSALPTLVFSACFVAMGVLPSTRLFSEENRSGENPALRLPPGDSAAGREAFLALKCVHCHGVAGASLDHPELHSRLQLDLARAPRYVTDYESLVTAITNPRHVIREQYGELLSTLDQDEWQELPSFGSSSSTE